MVLASRDPETKLQGSDAQTVKPQQAQNGLPNCNSRLTVQPFFTISDLVVEICDIHPPVTS